MYSKQQASHLRQEFWTAFGRYMQPVLSADGMPVNWVNYKTGARHIQFRMDAGKGASVSIVLSHPDTDERRAMFARLLTFRDDFIDKTGAGWEWEEDIIDDSGKNIARVIIRLADVHVFNKADWPSLISFFKQHMIALDAFWTEVKFAFDVR